MLKAWTDYPFEELGDAAGVEAPVRECVVLSYDGNKYCRIEVGGVTTEVKAGYLYRQPGRVGEVPTVRYRDIVKLQPGYRRQRGKPASFTISYVVYEPDYQPGMRYAYVGTKSEALRLCRRFGRGSEAVRQFHIENRNGASRSFSDPRPFVFQ